MNAPDSPFWHYTASFDAIALIRRHAAGASTPAPGFLTSYFGVVIDPDYFPTILPPLAGTVEAETLPANWHADAAEFAAALRAIELSGDRFTMAELGCGWGCWMSLTGVAARRSGRNVRLIGVEGDEMHAAWAEATLARNGFASDDYLVHRGIAAARRGAALFPRVDNPSGVWGSEPVFGASWWQRRRAVRRGTHDVLAMIPIDALVDGADRLDLLHVDIQGGEMDLVAGSLDILSQKVAYMVIGTHSRAIEGRLTELLQRRGWLIEVERPAILDFDRNPLFARVDGVQGWRNPMLLPL